LEEKHKKLQDSELIQLLKQDGDLLESGLLKTTNSITLMLLSAPGVYINSGGTMLLTITEEETITDH
jgi:hypothetical protein